MPGSLGKFREIVKGIVTRLPQDIDILDLGAGEGNYARKWLPKEYRQNFDAIEVYEPYIEKYGLCDLYRDVYVQNATEFGLYANYDVVLISGVFEHFTVEEANLLMDKFKEAKNLVLLIVPHNYPQDEGDDGNPYEIHHQDDLFPDVMYERYPDVVLWKVHRRHGFYTVDHGDYISDEIREYLENLPQHFRFDTHKFKRENPR